MKWLCIFFNDLKIYILKKRSISIIKHNENKIKNV